MAFCGMKKGFKKWRKNIAGDAKGCSKIYTAFAWLSPLWPHYKQV